MLLPHELEAIEKEKQKSKLQKLQEQIAADENKVEEPKPTKWYMGDYATNEGKHFNKYDDKNRLNNPNVCVSHFSVVFSCLHSAKLLLITGHNYSNYCR